MKDCALRVGVIPMPDFTMLALSGFIDTLRLAADEGDRSRPIRCAWTVMSEGRRPVRASNGVTILPQDELIDPRNFDYVAVVGGLIDDTGDLSSALATYLRQADAASIPLLGLCTGSLILARAGLMDGRTACVSWFHHDDYVAEFPHHDVTADRLFVDAGDRITCAGGVSVVHLASWLVERHLGPGTAEKGLRIMIEEQQGGGAPQPTPPAIALRKSGDARVRRALLAMERNLVEPLRLGVLAASAGVSARQLSRLFAAELGKSPGETLLALRLARAERMLSGGNALLADIAAECGFCDGAHLTRRFRAAFGASPRAYRAALRG